MTIRVSQYKRRGETIPGTWEIDIRVMLPTGEKHRERVKFSGSTKEGARRWADQRAAFLISHGPQTPEGDREPTPTMSEFAPKFIEWATTERQKPSEIQSKQNILNAHLLPLMGHKRLDELTPLDLQALKTKLKDRKPKTLNNVLAVLSKLLKVAVDFEVIDAPPISAKGKKADAPEMEFYEFDDYAKLVEAAESIGGVHLLVVLLGGDAGLRRGEILALEWDDVDLKRGIITVRRSDYRGEVTAPKGNRSRKVPMTQKLVAALEAHQQVSSGRVLRKGDAEPATAEAVKWWMQAVQRKANVEVNGKLHVLRHTFCSHLAMKGANAVTIKDLAGHQSLETTMRYMHLSPNHKTTAIALLDDRGTKTQNDDAATSSEKGGQGEAERTSPRSPVVEASA